MNNQDAGYISRALYIHTQVTESRLEDLRQFSPDIEVTSERIETFLAQGYTLDPTIHHLVVSASLQQVKAVMEFALRQNLSLGILPQRDQRQLCKYIGLSSRKDDAIELALHKNQQAIDVIRCNGELVLFSASIGRFLTGQRKEGHGFLDRIRKSISNLYQLRLIGFKFTVPDRKRIDTAATGCIVVTQHATSRISRMISHDESAQDGLVSLLIAAPGSVVAYLGFLYRVLKGPISTHNLPNTFGYIKTRQVTIETSEELTIKIDGYPCGKTPAEITADPLALKINRVPVAANARIDSSERVHVGNLPTGAEKVKAMKKKLPLFPYATEERFKDLFVLLRQDASLSRAYVVLMILSTMLATVGLFLNSSSVIIGAMLLAPLMAPIVSLAMGILRSDKTLYFQSAKTISAGIVIALAASVLVTQLLPNELVTAEMSARLNPSLLDLAVAIFAGIAAAYTKSNKEMMSGLAGVAIAVALVPPLAVSGIGLGRFDPVFFSQAFLLFSTNLVGIIVSAALVFRVLGYSAVIRAKKSFVYILLTMALISLPLYFSYDDVVEGLSTSQAWKKERFLVNGKYLIVRKTKRYRQQSRDVIEMEIYARENLTREDLDVFKAKIKENFEQKLIIRAKVTYIL